MEEIVDCLFYTLFCKGFSGPETLRLVEDVVHIVVSDGGEFTTDQVNRKLEGLGWHETSVDPFTLKLIMAFLLNDQRHEVGSPAIH